MRNGFTLVELLVVIAISAMLSAIAIAYTSVGRNQVAISVESAKIANSILRVKNLSVATYNDNPATCGYGVFVNVQNNTYSMFAFNPPNPCPGTAAISAGIFSSSTEMGEYSSGDWNVPLANGVHLASGGNNDGLAVILFIPPAPVTLISRDGSTFLQATTTDSRIYLVSADGRSSSTVSVNSAGQVSF